MASVCVGAGFRLAMAATGGFVGIFFAPQIFSLGLAGYFALRYRRLGFVAGVVLVILAIVFLGLFIAFNVHGV